MSEKPHPTAPCPFSIDIPGGRTGVLLLHGLSGTPNEMRSLAEHLGKAGHTVSCPLLAGHCGSYDDLKQSTWQDWAASAEAALARLRAKCDLIVVGGLSTGAILSLLLAARHPDGVHGVIPLAPTLWLNGWMIPKHAHLFRLVLQKPVANMFDFPDMFPHGVKDEAIRAEVKAAIDSGDSSIAGLPVTPGGAVIEHRWLVQTVIKQLRHIAQPTLIIAPREDDYADMNNVAYLQRHLAGIVDTVILNDSYHIITVDRQRHIVNERSATFIDRLRSEAAPSVVNERTDTAAPTLTLIG
ncbi:MAG: alpha/beta fold hydrolase [Hyphomicrobiaceae bacterium]